MLPLIAAVITVLVAASIGSLALTVGALVPTALTDELAPEASPVVAAVSLGIAQVLGILLTALMVSLIGAVLLAHLSRYAARLSSPLTLQELHPTHTPHSRPRAAGVTLAAAAVALAVILSAAAVPTLQRLSSEPDTLVLGHRGFSDGGVENTLGGLEAAAAAGADLVEMDVMQSQDGRFIAMHDANLARLAGMNMAVKDLTSNELTQLTVRDLAGNEDTIPSFTEYVTRADQLGMPLLIEIKLGGGDTADHVQRLVSELEGLGLLERNIYHSLDAASVSELKRLRPDLTVEYTMAFAAVDVPDTPADFIVIEEWSATQDMQDSATAAGLGFFAWTVNDEKGMRELLRRDIDGIITDHPDAALQLRTEMQQQQGLADTLLDALSRFVLVF